MLPKDEEGLWAECVAAEIERDRHMAKVPSMVRKGHGPAYSNEGSNERELTLENHFHEYCSLMAPRLVMDNPRVRVTSRDWSAMQAGEDGMSEADSLSHCLNRWIRDERLDETLVGYANDGFYCHGVAYVTQEELGGWQPDGMREGLEDGEEPMKPSVFTIEPDRVFWDAVATDLREIRFIGHTYVRDKEDLLKEAEENPDKGWIESAINQAEPSHLADDKSEGRHVGINRGELRIREIWVPEHNDYRPEGEDGRGFHGTLYTIAEGKSASGESVSSQGFFIREPQPYYGHPQGPYVVWGAYPVMGDTYPLSPLMAVEPQISRLNDLSLAYSNAARKAKSGLAAHKVNEDAMAQWQKFQDQGVFLVDGDPNTPVKQMVDTIEVGGPHERLFEFITVERDRLERVSGLSDAQRGNVTGQGTATEVAIADSASSVRVDYIKKRFTAAVQQILERAAWYFMEDERSRYVLSPEVAALYGMDPSQPVFYRPPDDDTPFAAYEFEIEAYSMERVSEGMHQKKIIDFMTLFAQVAPLAAQLPGVAPWNDLMKKVAEAMNIPDVGSLIDEEKAAQVGAEMQAMGQDQQAGSPGAGGSLPMMPGQAMGAGLNGGLI